MQVSCKNCGVEFIAGPNGRSVYCKVECYEAYYHRVTKLRYRNDSAFREATKTQALRRYYERKMA